MPSGQRAPHLHKGPKPEDPLIRTFNTEQMVELLKRTGGTEASILESRDLMEMLLPMLRADFTLIQEYVYSTKEKLSVPFVCFTGNSDKLVDIGTFNEWNMHTEKLCKFHEIAGGHFFFQENFSDFIQILTQELSAFNM